MHFGERKSCWEDGGKKRKHTLQHSGIHEYIIILSVTFESP